MIIEINHFPIYLRIGHYQYEKENVSKILLNLKCSYTLLKQNDDLSSVPDYDKILISIIELTETQITCVNLLETLITEIASMLMEKFITINQITIKAHKTELSTKLTRNSNIYVSETFNRIPKI